MISGIYFKIILGEGENGDYINKNVHELITAEVGCHIHECSFYYYVYFMHV